MKVLVVVDMQNDFIDGSLGTKEAVGIVDNVVHKIEEYDKEGNMIIFTYDTHYSNYFCTKEGINLPVEHCQFMSNGFKLNENVNKSKDSIKKVRVDEYFKETFGSVKMAEDLSFERNGNPIESIELVGLCTDICVISNALILKAFMPEVEIIVDASCCAGVTPQSHKNAIEAMKMCQITIKGE